MPGKKISTKKAPKAIGPYSQAIEAQGFIFLSGQIPLDPETGCLIDEADIAAQSHRVMKNIEAVLTASGVGFENVVKTTIFTTDLSKFSTINEVYGSYFIGFEPPARSTIEVAALPLSADVEIEMIAVKHLNQA